MRGFRYFLLFITTAGQTLLYSNRIVFGFTVICQAPKHGNITRSDYYLNDKIAEAYMFLSQALGQCLYSIPLYLLGWAGFGTNMQFLVFGGLSSIATLLFPLGDSHGFAPALVLRFITGMCASTQLYFTNEMVMRWAPESEKSIFLSVLLCCIQFGPLITMSLGGIMCEKLSWEYTYYVLGALTLLLSIAYFAFFTDDVQSSRFCSEEEKEHVLKGKHSVKRPPVPYRKLLTDLGVLTNIFLFSSYYVGLILYNQYSPTFLNKVLGYGTMITGYYAAIPMVFAIIVKLALGKLIDHGMGLSVKWRLAIPTIFFQIFTVSALVLIGIAVNRTIVLISLMTFATLAFFAPVISSRTIQIITGPHAHFVINANMFLCGIIQILIPLGVHLIVGEENKKSQWSLIFYIVAVLAVLCTVMYVTCVDAKLAKWAETPKETEEPKEEQNNLEREGEIQNFKTKL